MDKKAADPKTRSGAVAVTLVYIVAVLLCLTTLNTEQCPAEYNQAQVDASGCVIGANIGLPLTLFVLTDIWAIALLYVWFRKKPSKK